MKSKSLNTALVLTILIGAAIMDQKQYDDFTEKLGGEKSKSALAFAEIFTAQNKKDDEDEPVSND